MGIYLLKLWNYDMGDRDVKALYICEEFILDILKFNRLFCMMRYVTEMWLIIQCSLYHGILGKCHEKFLTKKKSPYQYRKDKYTDQIPL